eukprot:11563505-Alexandrium_andersonii.AAC.1
MKVRTVSNEIKPTETAPPGRPTCTARTKWAARRLSRPQSRSGATSQINWLRGIWQCRARGHPCRPT